MPDDTAPLHKNDPLAFTFLIAMTLAAAVVTGALLSGIATGAVQDLLDTAGFGQNDEIRAEQRRQALALEKIELLVGRMRADIALLNTRIDDAEKLGAEAASSVPGIDGDLDLGALRTSLDEREEHTRNALSAVNKRIDWLERLVYSQDMVSSAQVGTSGRRQSSESGWFVLHGEEGVAVIAGKDGAIDVTPGFEVPDLGRVTAICQDDGRWAVVMDNGMTIRER